MFSPASSSNVSSCVRSVRKSYVDGLCLFTSFAQALPFFAQKGSSESASLGGTRSAKRTAASLPTISRTRACSCVWSSSDAGLGALGERLVHVRVVHRCPRNPHRSHLAARLLCQQICYRGTLPAHNNDAPPSVGIIGFLTYGCEVCGEAGPLRLDVV